MAERKKIKTYRPNSLGASPAIENHVLDANFSPVGASKVGNTISKLKIASLDNGIPRSTVGMVRERPSRVRWKSRSGFFLSDVRTIVSPP